jgi:hypothetical protein
MSGRKRIVVFSISSCKKPLKLTGRQIGVRWELFVIGFQQTVESTEMCCLVQDKRDSSYHTSLNATDIGILLSIQLLLSVIAELATIL